MSFKDNIDKTRLPKHIAIIMDGNGRWAKERGKDRSFGHRQGVESVRTVTRAAGNLGIDYLTLYTFSTENWSRPEEEVNALMTLMVMAIEQETPDLMKNNVRLSAIGDLERMPSANGFQYWNNFGVGTELFFPLGIGTRGEIFSRRSCGETSSSRRYK